MEAPATPDQKHGTSSGFAGGNVQSSFCGGMCEVVAYMSRRLAIPNNHARLGSKRLASGIPTGDLAGRLKTAQP